jgi:hypothetical protein
MKLIHLLAIPGLLTVGASLAAADGGRDDFTGTYLASLPLRAEIFRRGWTRSTPARPLSPSSIAVTSTDSSTSACRSSSG